MSHDFEPGFQGSGPMFPALQFGNPTYEYAAQNGGHSWVVERENGYPAGESVFVDRAAAEQVADAAGADHLTHWAGLVGHNEPVHTLSMDAEMAGPPASETEAKGRLMFGWPWQWPSSGATITESEAARIQNEAAAKGEVALICARMVPDHEPEAG